MKQLRIPYSLRVLGLAALFFGSFGDEAAQMVFALRLVDPGISAGTAVAALLIAGLLGGILAGPSAPYVLQRLSAQLTMVFTLLAEALLVALASLVQELLTYSIPGAGLAGGVFSGCGYGVAAADSRGKY